MFIDFRAVRWVLGLLDMGEGGFAPLRGFKCHGWGGDQLSCWPLDLIGMSDTHLGTLTSPACQGMLVRTVNWAQLEYLLVANFLASRALDLLCISRCLSSINPSTRWFVNLLNWIKVFVASLFRLQFGDCLFSFRQLSPPSSRLVCFTNPRAAQNAYWANALKICIDKVPFYLHVPIANKA